MENTKTTGNHHKPPLNY
jgi:hypothetical protein